jgi:quinol-cytochrome oxidoreductase complex cytochrome b subunit
MVVVIAILVIILNFISLLASSSLSGRGRSLQLEKIAPFECGLEPFGHSRVKFEVLFYLVALSSYNLLPLIPNGKEAGGVIAMGAALLVFIPLPLLSITSRSNRFRPLHQLFFWPFVGNFLFLHFT